LRFAASFVTTLNARFGEEDLKRRAHAFRQIGADPSIGAIVLTAFAGPERVPAECFTEAFYANAFGTTQHLVL